MPGEVLTPEVIAGGTYDALLESIGELLSKARSSISHHISTTLAHTYWSTGRHIVEYGQNGAHRAKYGANLMHNLVRDLCARYGRGFSKTNLIYMSKFYLVFRKSQTVSDLLSWGRRGYQFNGWAQTAANANNGVIWKGDWGYVATPVAAGSTLMVYASWTLKPGYCQIRFNRF